MSTETGNSREIFSLYSVSPIPVLSETEALFLPKEENKGFFLGSCLLFFFSPKYISGFFEIRLLLKQYGKVRKKFSPLLEKSHL